GLEEREISFILGVRMRNQKLVREEVLSRAGRFEQVRQESDVVNDPHLVLFGCYAFFCMN
ncbi:MAG: hypothetical protein NT040_19980, partial [Bacteroidetes bacterium]|nr:hypothetical protein [Bacteroidota bacterium]